MSVIRNHAFAGALSWPGGSSAPVAVSRLAYALWPLVRLCATRKTRLSPAKHACKTRRHPPPSRRDRVQGVAHVLTRALGILEHHGVEVVVVVVGRTRAHPPNQIPSSISISDTPTSSDNSTPWVGFSSRFFRRRILLCITGPPPRTWSYVRRLSSRLWVYHPLSTSRS